jgi:hypothetical protein
MSGYCVTAPATARLCLDFSPYTFIIATGAPHSMNLLVQPHAAVVDGFVVVE